MSKIRDDRRFEEYAKRNIALLSAGFSSYDSYLRTDLWQELRNKVRSRSGGTCECCRIRRSSQVHHMDYSLETMLGKSIDGLMDLCGRCHSRIEIIWSATPRKRGFKKVQKLLATMIAHHARKLLPKQTVETLCHGCGKVSQKPINSWKRGKKHKCECGGSFYRKDPIVGPSFSVRSGDLRVSHPNVISAATQSH